MNAILEGINSAGRAFVEFAGPMLVQSSVLIAILLAGDFLLRRKVRAVLRYWLWMLVLVKLVLPISLTTPVSLGQWFGVQLEYVQAEHTPAVVSEVTEPRPVEMGQEYRPVEAEPVEVSGERLTPSPVTVVEPAVTAAAPEAVSITPVRWQGWVFLGWLAVVVAMGLLLLQRVIFVLGLVAQAKGVNGLMGDTLKYCCGRMGVRGRIGLKVSANATSPAVCGLFRPVILVPQDLGPNLGAGGLRVVLMHELAHIRRGDLWVNLVQTVLQIIYFYNPLLWVANAVIRRVREQAVDEAVQVAMGEKAGEYPETLVRVAKLAFERPALSLRLIGVVESKSTLQSRVRRMLERPLPKSAKLGFIGLAMILVIGAILLPMAKGMSEPPEFVIKGRVTAAETGQPIAGAKVGDVEKYAEGQQLTTTDSDGNYSYLTWYEEHGIKAEADGYKRQNKGFGTKLFGSEKEKVIDFALAPATVITIKQVMKQADSEARLLNHEYIGTEHILLALASENSGAVSEIFKEIGIGKDKLHNEVLRLIKKGEKPVTKKTLPLTPRAELTHKNANQWAKAFNSDTVESQHVLLGLLQVEDGVGAQVLMDLSLNLKKAQEAITNQSGQEASEQKTNSTIPAEFVGHWKGQAKIIVSWTKQKNLPIVIEVNSDGNVEGKIGDAKLINGRLVKKSWVYTKVFQHKNPYRIEGDLQGEIIKSENIQRDSVTISMRVEDGKIDGGLGTSGTKTGNKENMILSAMDVSLIKVDESARQKLTPDQFTSKIVLSLKTGLFIPKQQADESKEPYLHYCYTFPPGANTSKYTVRNIPEAYIGIEAGNMDLAGGDFSPESKSLDGLWSIETIEQLPEFQQRIKITVGEHTSNGTFIFPPLDRNWPYITAFKGDDGTYGVFEIRQIENRNVYVRYKTLNSPNASAKASDSFTAMLDNGVTVELVGVCEHPSEGKQWWRPDGSLLGEPPYEYLDTRSYPVEGEKFCELVFKSHQFNNDVSLRIKTQPGGGGHGAIIPERGRGIKPIKELRVYHVEQEKDVEICNVSLGVAAGPWQTLAVSDGIPSAVGGSKRGNISIAEAFENTKGQVVVTVTDDIRDKANRILAIRQDGSILKPQELSGAGMGKFRQTTVKFEDCKLREIKEFQFQTRPYEWVEFKNVSLEPNFKTDVQVEVEKTAVGVEGDDVTAQKLASQAAALMNRGDFKEAQRLIAEAVKQKPDFAEAWVGLGMSFVKLGNDKEAKNAYETALRIHSKRYAQQPNPNELLQQSYVLFLLGRENTAQQLLNQAKAEYPDNHQVMLFSEVFNKHKGDLTEYRLGSDSDMQVEGEKTEQDEQIEKISRLINAELPRSVSNVKFLQRYDWFPKTFVKFDIPFSDLKMLLRQSYMLPDFGQLSKDGEIRIPMQKDKIGPDWWKPEELNEPLYGHWARGYYAPEGIDIWIHYEWDICCSEINQGQMRVYLYSWSEGDTVYWNAHKKQIIEDKLKQVLDDPNVIKQVAEQFFNKIRTADYDYFLNSKNPKVWKEFPIVRHYNALQGYQYPDLVMWICRTFKKNPITSVQIGNPIASMDKWPVLSYTITLKDGKIIEGDLRFTYHSYDPEQVYGKEVVDRWLGVHGIDWNLKPESELYQIPKPAMKVEGGGESREMAVFESYFPYDADSGRKLTDWWENKDSTYLDDDSFFDLFRKGLRTCTIEYKGNFPMQHIGGEYIWRKEPDEPRAVDIVYHASFSPEFKYYAVYSGLSVANPKSEKVLRRLVDIAMEPHQPGRIIWGVKQSKQEDEFVALLEPYMGSLDLGKSERADIVVKALRGEIDADKWEKEGNQQQKTERTIREFGDDLPRIKKTFLTGTSEERLEAIKFINKNIVSLTHDQSFIRALDACSQDSDANVRAGAASFLGYNYIWGKSVQPKEVIEVLLRLSKDKDRGVRYQAVYCGLSVVENKDESIIKRLVEVALDKTSDFGRISWGLSRGADEEIIKKYLIPHLTHESTKAKLARKLHRELFKEEPPEVERKPTVEVETKEP